MQRKKGKVVLIVLWATLKRNWVNIETDSRVGKNHGDGGWDPIRWCHDGGNPDTHSINDSISDIDVVKYFTI